MDEEIAELIHAIEENWGSEDEAYNYLNRLADELNRQLFDGRLSPVSVGIVPRSILHGPMGAHPDAGASYEPSDTGTATIYLGVRAIRSKEHVREVLAHELVHHWELTIATNSDSRDYPSWIDDILRNAYPDKRAEERWRAGHSPRFIAMAHLVANKMGVHVARLLSGQTAHNVS